MSAEFRTEIRTEMDVRRAVLASTQYCQQAGFDETPSRMVATAVSELTRNILKYAGSGEFRIYQIERAAGRGVEIEVSDHGPGIPDVESAMSDHFSSSGTLGLGLPGVKRLMDDFSLDSSATTGTRIRAKKWI